MAFTLNKNRTFQSPVIIHSHDEKGKPIQGKIRVTFRVVDTNNLDSEDDESFFDQVVVGIKGLTINDEKGQSVVGDDLLEAAKGDPEIAIAIVSTYNKKITSKNLHKT